jgi:acetyl esterase
MLPPEPRSILGQTMRKALRAAVRTPEPLSPALFGPPPTNDRGGVLDAQTHRLLVTMRRTGAPRIEELPPPQARQAYRRASQLFDYVEAPCAAVEDRRIPGPGGDIDLRVYRPHGLSTTRRSPAVVFYHGGGFVIGCLATYEGFCRTFAALTSSTVISVHYRLSPEHPFPCAVHDAVAAFAAVVERAGELGVDPARIAVAGDSAGATLATVVCQQQALTSGPAPLHQLLIYPRTDQTRRYPSQDHFAEGYYLTGPAMDWFARCYLRDADHGDPRISPLLFDALDTVAAATVVTAGFDPLRDEGEAYAAKLNQAGRLHREHRFDALIHGFVSMGGLIDAAHKAIATMAREFSDILHG